MANRRAFARTYDDWMPPTSRFARPRPTALTNPPVAPFPHPSRMANRSVATSPNPTRLANHRRPGCRDSAAWCAAHQSGEVPRLFRGHGTRLPETTTRSETVRCRGSGGVGGVAGAGASLLCAGLNVVRGSPDPVVRGSPDPARGPTAGLLFAFCVRLRSKGKGDLRSRVVARSGDRPQQRFVGSPAPAERLST